MSKYWYREIRLLNFAFQMLASKFQSCSIRVGVWSVDISDMEQQKAVFGLYVYRYDGLDIELFGRVISIKKS
jgi:hypothetical protein